jgi:hypothetical protein
VAGDELIVQGGGEVLEAGQLFVFHLLFFFLEQAPIELLLELEQVPEHARQFMRHGGGAMEMALDSLWTSRPRSCTILFMGVWFLSLMMDQALPTPLILRIRRHTPITRSNKPKSNTHLTSLRSHRV